MTDRTHGPTPSLGSASLSDHCIVWLLPGIVVMVRCRITSQYQRMNHLWPLTASFFARDFLVSFIRPKHGLCCRSCRRHSLVTSPPSEGFKQAFVIDTVCLTLLLALGLLLLRFLPSRWRTSMTSCLPSCTMDSEAVHVPSRSTGMTMPST